MILIFAPPSSASDQYMGRDNEDVVIARLLRMHFQDEASHSHLQLQNEYIGANGLSILVIISPEN